MKKHFIIFLSGLLAFSALKAQEVETEKTFEISRKSKRGFLSGLDYDHDQKTYSLTYITKITGRKIKYETYQFDNDFNFLKDEEGEEVFEKMKAKYKWFNYRDLYYAIEGVTVENNFTGTLVLKRKRINFAYDFLVGGYTRVVTLAEKLKPKTDDGRKMTLITYFEDSRTGDLLVLASIKPKLGKNMAENNPRPYDMHLMRFNKDLDILAETVIPFDYPQTLASVKTLYEATNDDPENPGIASMVAVFAPTGGVGLGKVADKDNNNYTYLRMGADTKIIHRFNFNSTSSYWNIDEIVHDPEKDEIYVFGPSAAGKDKYYNESISITKFKAVQLMKVTDQGKQAYLTETNLEEFNAKLKTPPSQKKAPAYEGKKFDFSTYKVASNGDFFVSGQNYKIDKMGNDQGSKNYKDVMAFHFDINGKLKAEYSVDTKENNSISDANGTPQFFIEGRNGDNVFWVLREIKDFSHGKLLTYPRIAKISKNTELSDFQTLGKNEGFFLDPKYPYLETDKGNRLVFFGANKSGRNLWFCKVKLN